jgi:hypothetical protein
MAKLIRLDIINGNPRSFVAPAELEQGLFLEIIGKAENVDLGVNPDFEAYKVKKASANTERGQLLLHASVANQYDATKGEIDFVLEEGRVGRGYQPIMGDIVTIAKVDGVAVGDKLALGADGLLVKDEAGKLAIVEALEDINVPGAEPQKSMVIRFL